MDSTGKGIKAYAMRAPSYEDTFHIMSSRDNVFGRVNEKRI